MKVPPSMMKPAGNIAFTPHIERYFPTRGPEIKQKVSDAAREDGSPYMSKYFSNRKSFLKLARKTALTLCTKIGTHKKVILLTKYEE